MSEKDKPTIPIDGLQRPAPAPVDPLVGYRIDGRYELLEPLARGGFGRVYKARDMKLERIIAIKLVDVGSNASDDTRARMLREARANARLHHPSVVVLHDAGEDEHGLYLVLEYVAGTTLAEALGNGPIEARRASEIARECAEALAAAHAHGIVHRDIKPGNILLTESGRVKVADFGVARLVGEARLTDKGSIIGTPNYMAPEQIDGSSVGASADMFALGCVFYEMISGRTPFTGVTTSEVLGRILRSAADPLPLLDTSVAPLVDAIALLLEKQPDRRLLPHELIARLRSWERHDGDRRRRPGKTTRPKTLIAIAVIIVAAVIGTGVALQKRELPPLPEEASVLVRVADTAETGSELIAREISFSSRDAVFAYRDFVGRDRSQLTPVDDLTISIQGRADEVQMRAEEAHVIDQLLGYDFFRESNLFTEGTSSTRAISCDFPSIAPSEFIALVSAAAGWPVVQSAAEPLESSALLRVHAVNQPWDEVVTRVMRAAGLSAYRYETISLITGEDVPIYPRSRVLLVKPRRFSSSELVERLRSSGTKRGVLYTSESNGAGGVIMVDSAEAIQSALTILSEVRGGDWDVTTPRSFDEPPITMRLDSLPMDAVLEFYGKLSGRRYQAGSDLDGFVRANIVEIPADEFLAAVLEANGLTTTDAEEGLVVQRLTTVRRTVRPTNLPMSAFEPLVSLASAAAARTGLPATIEFDGDIIIVSARRDVAADITRIILTIDQTY